MSGSADAGADERAHAEGDGHGEQAATDVAYDGALGCRAAQTGTDETRDGEGQDDSDDGHRHPQVRRGHQDGEQRHESTEREGEEGCARGAPRVRQGLRIEAEFGLGVGLQSVLRRELLRDLTDDSGSSPLST